MTNRTHALFFLIFWVLTASVSVRAATWVDIAGHVRLADGTPICALVLANGQYVFSCDGTGAYNLNIPLGGSGLIEIFAFADGFAPFSRTSGPGGFPYNIRSERAAPNSPQIYMTRDIDCSEANEVRVYGEIESVDGQGLCALVLSNGQHMFSCGGSEGRYDLNVPVDENGHVTVFGFADGFQPYKDTFVAPECGTRFVDAENVDLVITSVSDPGAVLFIGESKSGFSATVENRGADKAGRYRVNFFLSTDRIITLGDIDTDWGCIDEDGLAAGESFQCSGAVEIPSDIEGGNFYVGAYADVNDAVNEFSENNNGLASSKRLPILRQILPVTPSCSLQCSRAYSGCLAGCFELSMSSRAKCGDACKTAENACLAGC